MKLTKTSILLAFAAYVHAISQCAMCPFTLDGKSREYNCVVVDNTYCAYTGIDGPACVYTNEGSLITAYSRAGGICPANVGTTTNCFSCFHHQ
ncbi:hypothetical protein EDC04DRAFT_216990 [Pisolithus marmoratus]|nr:hypothetical protein EDC04DRAFT_216990 [Pisolithus marmoratus]